MKNKGVLKGILFALLGVVVTSPTVKAVDPVRLDKIKATAEQVKKFADKLSEPKRKALSSGAQNMIQLAERWKQFESRFKESGEPERSGPSGPSGPARAAVARASDPNADLRFSSMGGFTQSETSTAWCGNNVVIGFNDSG